ncbi:hypothetical protein DSL72_007456 [Monilinia vaccinii-corymbosi]|uniref:Uncharacterized protein n=1 Tax=Monilinia vaccinii-corymbosi TaxID=61207 RepID=A0A8A3PMG6_9HELO|nr:hypothetical protein DSL72_007456 [Monilinia vaccinii-corymbosi]
MSSYYQHFNAHQQHTTSSNAQNGSVHNRSRRNARLPQNKQNNQYQKIVKREEELAAVLSYRRQFEYARSFDLEDDAEFCPNLLTEEDMVSINGSGSDRSSLASGSPTSSPQSTQVSVNLSPDTHFSLNSNPHPFVQSGFASQLKIHQPSATRIGRNAIPIVNPNDGGLMSSPPSSVSPARMQQHQQTRVPLRFY